MLSSEINSKRASEGGFTLIELSIVLVIIGLIVGGVLVGQDLIKAAQIRASVTQLEKYNTAVNTFRGKYNGLPGDLASPTNFFSTITGSGSGTGLGNGNGLIESSGTDLQGLNGETAVFWNELFQANMISENITTVGLATQVLAISSSVLPLAKLGSGNYVHTAAYNGINYWAIVQPTGSTTAASGDFATTVVSITPNQAYQFDSKIDDGLPLTGIVQSGSASGTGVMSAIFTANGVSHATGSLAAGDCYDSTLSIYATSAAATKDVSGCVLRVRASF